MAIAWASLIKGRMNDALTAIQARRVEIARALEALGAEDRELATTEDVLARLGAGSARPARVVALDAKNQQRPKSQREFVLDALARSPEPWLRAKDIIALVHARWDEDIPELSLRPLLSTLKHSRHIVREGRFVALKERANAHHPAKREARR